MKLHLRLRAAVADVHKGLGGVQPEHAHSPLWFVGEQQRHGAVQAEAAVQLVGEDVQVVQTIRFPVSVEGQLQNS